MLVCVFTTYFNRTMNVLQSNSKALKTDNMIVVVRADDPAQSLQDAKDYKYAVHTSQSMGGSNAMITYSITLLVESLARTCGEDET